jgi:hypothetical protein
MRNDVVIWNCSDCDYWEWGNLEDCLTECPECGGDLQADETGALDTYYCEQHHASREDSHV